MRLFHHTIWIARPRDAVFDFFLDFAQAPRWRSYVKSMEPLQPGPVREGSRIRVSMDLMGNEHEFELTVLACERPALWRHKSDETDLSGHLEYRFEPDAGGTRVTMSCEAKPTSLYGWLSIPMLVLARNKSYRDQLPQLKRALEGG